MENIEIEIQNVTRTTARLFREKLLADPYRPGYHFSVPANCEPGDPNGAFYANGRYHLMYLYNCASKSFNNCGSDNFRYGHASSLDLIHWRFHPDALIPDELDGGIWAGGAFVDDDGTAYMTYWALERPGRSGGIRIAKSNDPLYEKWEKYQNYAVTATLPGRSFSGATQITDENGKLNYVGCCDPSNIWKKDGKYYMQAGNLPILMLFQKSPVIHFIQPIRGMEGDVVDLESADRFNIKGDWVDLFESADLVNWQYIHRFYERNASNTWTAEDEDDMCPSFLPLPKSKSGGEMSGNHLQLFISHNRGCQYYIGKYDAKNDLFIPEKHGRMSWADTTYFAPEALIDPKGRQIMWAWLTDNREAWDSKSRFNLFGVYGLPRTLWLNEKGELGIAPIEELKLLRYNEKIFGRATLDGNNRYQLEGINGESCEIKLSVDMRDEKKAGIIVRSSPDESEATYIYYDADNKQLVLDTSRGTTKGRPIKETAPFALYDNEKLELTVYIDKSVIEIFANERQAAARRVYPERADSIQVKLFCENGRASFEDIAAWEMMPSNMY